MKILYFILIAFLLMNCISKTERYYYPTGELKAKKTYLTYEDTSSYFVIKYFKNGEVSGRFEIKNSKLNGKYFVFNNDGKLIDESTYKSGLLNGLSKIYSDAGKLRKVLVYSNNRLIVYNVYYISKGGTLEKFDCYNLYRNDTGYKAGCLIYNLKTNKIEEELSFFYSVDVKDTLDINDESVFNLKLYTSGIDNCYFSFYLGKFDNNNKFYDSTKVAKSVKADSVIKFKYKFKESGYNLLLGLLQITRDSLSNKKAIKQKSDLIFYKEVFVKAK